MTSPISPTQQRLKEMLLLLLQHGPNDQSQRRVPQYINRLLRVAKNNNNLDNNNSKRREKMVVRLDRSVSRSIGWLWLIRSYL
jgi:hypothetical protein